MDTLLDQPTMMLIGGAIFAIVLIAQSGLFASTEVVKLEETSKAAAAAPSSSSSSGASKKKRKKNKKKSSTSAAAAKEPAVVEEEEETVPLVAEEEEVVAEEEPVEETPAPAPSAGSKKKKKKKKKGGATTTAAAPAPVPEAKEEEPEPTPVATTTTTSATDNDDEDDDDDDVARLLSANQLSKAQSKKKKKKRKKKKGSSGEGDDDDEQKDADDDNWVTINKKHHKEDKTAAITTTEGSGDEAVSTVTLSMEAADKPIIVGPKGATITHITATSGARLDIDLPVLKITGTSTAIAIAREMVHKLISEHKAKSAFSTTLAGKDIKSSEGIKAIIGKGGSTIQQIQTTTGCKLDASIDDGKVVITGPSEAQVQQAATLCRHAVFGEHQVTMDLKDKSKVMLVLGHNFKKIREFQDQSGGAKLDIVKNSTVLKISGPTAAVNKARDMVNAWLNHCGGIALNIPQSAPGSFDKVGAIYGKGGVTIRTIQDKTGAFIHVDDKAGQVQISGVPAAVQDALRMVQQAMTDGCLMEEGEIKDAVSIPKKAGPSVIGRGGANIKELETKHNVKVRISGQTCIMIGKPDAVARCKADVAKAIEPFLEEERIQQEADRLAVEQEAAAAGASAWNASLHDDVADGW